MASRYPGEWRPAPAPQQRDAGWGADAKLSPGGYLFSTGLFAGDGPCSSPPPPPREPPADPDGPRSRGQPTRPRPSAVAVPQPAERQGPVSVSTDGPGSPAARKSAAEAAPESQGGREPREAGSQHSSRQSSRQSGAGGAESAAVLNLSGLKFRAPSSARMRSHTTGTALLSAPGGAVMSSAGLQARYHNPHIRRHGVRGSFCGAAGEGGAAAEQLGDCAERSASVPIALTSPEVPPRDPPARVPPAAHRGAARHSGGARQGPRASRGSVSGGAPPRVDSLRSSTGTIPAEPSPSDTPPAARASGTRRRLPGGGGGSGTTCFERLHGHYKAREEALEQRRAEALRASQEHDKRIERECTFEPNIERRPKDAHADAATVCNRLFQQQTAAREAQLSKTPDAGPGPGSYTPSLTDPPGSAAAGSPSPFPPARQGQGATARIPTLKEAQRSADRTSLTSRGTGSSHSSGGASGGARSAYTRPPDSARSQQSQSTQAWASLSAGRSSQSRVSSARVPTALAQAAGPPALKDVPQPRQGQRQSRQRTTSPQPRGAAQSLALLNGARPARKTRMTSPRGRSDRDQPDRSSSELSSSLKGCPTLDPSDLSPRAAPSASVVVSQPVTLSFRARGRHDSPTRVSAGAAASTAAAASVVGAIVAQRQLRADAGGPWGSPRGGPKGRVHFDEGAPAMHAYSMSWDSGPCGAGGSLSTSSHGDEPTEGLSDHTPREPPFSVRTEPNRTSRCIDCGQLLPSEMPYCPATGKRHGTVPRVVIQCAGGGAADGPHSAMRMRKGSGTSEQFATQSCMSLDQSDCATAIDRGSAVDPEEGAYTAALRSIKNRRHDLTLKELLSGGPRRNGAGTAASGGGDDTEDLITDLTAPGTPVA